MKTLLERYRVDGCKVLGKLAVIERDEDTLEFAIDDYQETCEDEPFVQTITHVAAKDPLLKVSPLYILIPVKWFSACQEEVKLIPKHNKYIVRYTNGGDTRLYLGRKFGEGRGSKLSVYREQGMNTVFITIPFDPSLGPRFAREEAISYIDAKIDELRNILCSAFNQINTNKAGSSIADAHKYLNYMLGYRFGTPETAATKINENLGVVGKRQDDLRLNLHKFQQMTFKERLCWLLYGE